MGTGPTGITGPAYAGVISYINYAGLPPIYAANNTELSGSQTTAQHCFYLGSEVIGTWTTTSQNNPVIPLNVKQFKVKSNGIYALTYSLGIIPSSGDTEMFISKNLGNDTEITTVSQSLPDRLLCSSRVYTQNTVTWTGYISTTDYICFGGYSDISGTIQNHCEITFSLIDGAQGATGQTGPIAFVPHAASAPLQVPPSSQTTPNSANYSNFYLTYPNYVKNQTNTGLLIIINGQYYQSVGLVPGGGLQIGVQLNGTEYDVGFALCGTINDYNNVTCSNIVATNLAAGTYTIQVKWKSIDYATNVYVVDTNAKWTIVVQEVLTP